MPYKVIFTNGRKTTFLYSADGVKLQSKVYNSSGTLEATYDYAGSLEYINNDIEAIYFSDGRVRIDNIDGYLKYDYFLKDHLGSNRVVFTNKVSYSEGGAGTKNIVILQENQLYPYGLNTEGAWAIASPYNRYQYTDKEWNNELKWNDHGARMYDPSVGRWWVTDPANQYASPYKAMGNNPVSYVDTDGQFAWLIPIAAGALFGGLIEADKASRQGLDVGNAFWRGALIGGISGGVGSAVAKNLASQHIGGFLGGVITGASTGFASGLASGLINKNQNFFGNLIQSTLIGGGIGGALGALDVIYNNNSSNDARLNERKIN